MAYNPEVVTLHQGCAAVTAEHLVHDAIRVINGLRGGGTSSKVPEVTGADAEMARGRIWVGAARMCQAA